MRDLIFVSMENWDDIWRRNQFICAGLLKRYPKMRILFVGLPRDVSHAIRKRKFAGLRAPHPINPPGYPQVTFCRPLKWLPTTLALGREFNDWVVRRTVRAWTRRLGMQHPVLWLNPHYAVHMAGKMGESQVLYDITDDWIELTQSPLMKSLTLDQDTDLCRRADHVIVCSQKLYENKKAHSRHLHLIPNGVDAEHYQRAMRSQEPLPDSVAKLAHPVLGYTGTLHPDRINVDLLVELAGNMRAGTLLLLGPNMLGAEDQRRLLASGRVVLHPPVPYQAIPEYMRAFDVCITPHLVTPFTESLNPIKLWEYLATGLPIISTPVAGFKDFPQHVYLATDADSFLRAVPEALSEPPSRVLARQALVRDHSWTKRLDQICDLLNHSATLVADSPKVFA